MLTEDEVKNLKEGDGFLYQRSNKPLQCEIVSIMTDAFFVRCLPKGRFVLSKSDIKKFAIIDKPQNHSNRWQQNVLHNFAKYGGR